MTAKCKEQATIDEVERSFGLSRLSVGVRLLQQLIAIPSVNPEQLADPSGADAAIANEGRLAEFLQSGFMRQVRQKLCSMKAIPRRCGLRCMASGVPKEAPLTAGLA